MLSESRFHRLLETAGPVSSLLSKEQTGACLRPCVRTRPQSPLNRAAIAAQSALNRASIAAESALKLSLIAAGSPLQRALTSALSRAPSLTLARALNRALNRHAIDA